MAHWQFLQAQLSLVHIHLCPSPHLQSKRRETERITEEIRTVKSSKGGRKGRRKYDCSSLPEACPHLQSPLGHLQFSGPQPHDVPPQVEHAKKEKVNYTFIFMVV